jgi:transposase
LGHNRDRKHAKSQVNFGLVADGEGRPVAVSILRGNVGDPKTVMPQVEKVTQRFGIGEFVLVGDRGMVTQRQIDALRRDHPGVQWITALRSEGVRKLVESGRLQMGLLDERNLFELEHPDFPGERLVACRNPELAERRRHRRTELLAATEVLLAQLQARVAAGRLKGRDRIGLAAGRFVNKYKVAKHFALDIGEALFAWSRRYGAIDAEAALAGLYVVRTSVPAHRLDGDDAMRDYKRLCGVERAFRSMKSVDLHVRPVYHWHEHRVEAHIFLCMLAFYVQWHLQQALEKTTFADEFPDREGRDPVAKAAPSPEARRKAATKRDAAGTPVTGLHSVLQRMETVVRNRCRWTARPTAGTFDLVTTPDERQRKVLELVEAITV